MNKQIVLDCERMKYPFTGLYYFCKELGKALIRQSAMDDTLQFSFYTPKRERGIFGENEKYITQKNTHKFFPKNISAFDIWHCTYQGSNYLPPIKSGIKVLTTIHDLNFLHEDKLPGKREKYRQRMQQLVDRSDVIITISHFVKADVIRSLNMNGKQMEVIYNGCNKPQCSYFKKPDIPIINPFFFTVGTINAKKNFHVLVAMLLGNTHDLLIAGKVEDPFYLVNIKKIAAELGVSDRVRFLGTVPDEEKFWLMQHCSAFCFPSIAEGFGLPVIEAMQFGTPVILSKATSLPEIGGDNALYFDGFDIESVSRTATEFLNTSITSNVKESLIARAQSFDWNVAAKRYCELYSTLHE